MESIMKHLLFFLYPVMILLPLSGCGIAVKGIADTAMGGTSEMLIIEPVQDLTEYNRITILPFTSTVGSHLDEKLLRELNNQVAKYSSKNKPGQNGKKLYLSGTVLHLTDGVYEKEIVLRLRFHDPEIDRTIGLVNVQGQANTIHGLNGVVDSLADSVSDLLVQNRFQAEKRLLD
jgi:hypothetical protein